MVERSFRKAEVAGSTPIVGYLITINPFRAFSVNVYRFRDYLAGYSQRLWYSQGRGLLDFVSYCSR